jgi:hypothetical protein
MEKTLTILLMILALHQLLLERRIMQLLTTDL